MAELLSDFGLDVHMVVAAIQIGHDERYLEYGAGTAFFPTAQAIEAGFEVLRIRRRGSSNEVRAGADVQAPAIAFTDEVRRRVFVVHGRNAALRKSMFDLLVSLGLDPIEWDDAIRLCGQGSPYVGDVIDRAMNHAVAIIVLLTGDDLAVLLPEFRKEGDPAHETCPTPQARPNVLFEAGMAFGKDSQRTILVQVGNVRPFSDIAGRHVVVLDNSPERRRSLADRLRTVGALVRPDSEVWLTAGDFSAVRQSETSGTYELTDEVIREKPDRVLLTAPGNLWHYDGLGFEVFARVMDEVVPNPVSF
jgi:predicted nucleotide-binding protein